MAIHRLGKIADYVVYLRENPHELELLFKELLIGVTNFFRDPEAFAVLQAQVIPKLFEDKPAGSAVRVWCAGCSTGEEAYSIAMCLMEYLDDAYLAELAGHFAALAPSHRATRSAQVDETAAQRAVRWVRRGDAVLGLPACSACHGEALTGVTPNVPGLLGLPADYLMAQLGGWRQGLRHARAPDCMARIARTIPGDDISAIAHWLAAQPIPGKPVPASSHPATWPLDCGSIPK